MNLTNKLIFETFIFLVWMITYATQTHAKNLNIMPTNMDTEINHIVATTKETANLGIIIYDLDNHKTLYAYQPKHFFHPASNNKLFTAYAALAQLGKDFHYQTKLMMDGQVSHGTLNGDIYLQFSGDPKLTRDQLKTLLASLLKLGIKKINGSLYLDDSIFDQDNWPPGTSHDDAKFGFGTLVHAINIDNNTIEAEAKFIEEGEIPDILYDKHKYPITIVNNLITLKQVKCSPQLITTVTNRFYLTGCINSSLKLSLAVQNMRLYARAVIHNILHELNLPTNDIKFKSTPKDAQLLGLVSSVPITIYLKMMLKESDNLIANALFKTLATHRGLIPGSWENGRLVMQESLADLFPEDTYRIIDGDGGSRYTHITPEQIIKLLKTIYAKPKLRNLFFESLPIGGIDGTLNERFTTEPYKGKVFAKTSSASQSGESALSGYLVTKNNRHIAFTILINGFIKPIEEYREVEDRICRYLINTAL